MPIFLFTDIEDSAQKWQTFRKAMSDAVTSHSEILDAAVKQFGGKVFKNTGDGIRAVFESRSALQCALALRDEMAKADWSKVGGLRIRFALHAGEAERKGDDYVGHGVDRAARVLATGWGGQIVLTPEALAASDLPEGASTHPLGTHLLEDLCESQAILELVHGPKTEKFLPLRSLSTRPNNLPAQSTPFFDREKELKQIALDFKDPACRLITLVGQGGIGKTRLILQAAADQLDDFKDGIYFVPLAAVTNTDTLVSAIAGAMHFAYSGEAEMAKGLLRFLKEKSILLVLDNFEHLLSGSYLLGEMLDAAPKLKILLSSRTRLNLIEERLVELGGMPITQKAAEVSSALKFFISCAQRTKKNFVLADKDREDATRICQLVGGVPLGIELAAAWIGALSCQEIREEIERNIASLSKGKDAAEKHQSLRAVFEFSWNLFSTEEKQAIRTLSVFQGGFLREPAEKVANCFMFLLSALVDKSLLRKSPSGRYEMPELIRQFSEEKLKADPKEYEAVRTRHSAYFCEFLSKNEKGLKSHNENTLLKEIGVESSNIRAGWQWAVEKQNAKLVNEAFETLFQYFEILALAQEGEKIFALAADGFSEPNAAKTPEAKFALARTKARQGWFCYQQGRFEEAEALIGKGLNIASKLKQMKEVGQCLHFLCVLYLTQKKLPEQEAGAAKSLEIYRELKDDWGIAWSLHHLAQRPKAEGDNEKAKKILTESLELFRKMEYEDGMAWNLLFLGQVSVPLKDYKGAEKYFRECIAIFDKHNNETGVGWALIDLERMYTRLEEYETAFDVAREAYNAFKAASYPDGLGWAEFYCSNSTYHMGNNEEALRMGRDGLRLFLDTGDLPGQAWSYSHLCETANALGQFEEAKVYGRKGIEIFTKLGQREGIGACQNNLAQAELGLNNLPAAERVLLQAIENDLAVKIRWRVLEALLSVADVTTKANNPSMALLLASVVLQDPDITKEEKAKALKLITELKVVVNKAEIKTIEDKAKDFSPETLATYLLGQQDDEVKI